VSAGLRHTCGIRADNTLYCWGYNSRGQLGIGSTVNKTTPTLVP
jgi:alpha-tubulin suppressor-like RCC1 family protein